MRNHCWSALLVLLLLFVTSVLSEVSADESSGSEKSCLADGTCSEEEKGGGGAAAEDDGGSDVTNATTDDDDDDDEKEEIDAEKEPECDDNHNSCNYWASIGECEKNPDYMHQFCQKSCKTCGRYRHKDEDTYFTEEERVLNEKMRNLQRDDFGAVQTIAMGYEDQIHSKLQEMHAYIDNIKANRKSNPDMMRVLDVCKNKNPNCAFWSVIDECTKNPAYMKMECALICQTCDQLSIATRCPLDPDAPNAWEPGDLNQMFLNITTLPKNQKYNPVVLSRPDLLEGDTDEQSADYQLGPWVVVLENFITDQEAERLIELGGQEGYVRSADVGEVKVDGTFESSVNNGRTSTNAWCQFSCYKDPTAITVMERIANLTNIPETNSEYLQLLKYEVGQFYQRHHDFIDHMTYRQQGNRLLTVFLYLNDVEAGGGTNFPDLDLTVMPKRGRALIWPSVLDSDPDLRDARTDHQALPVEKGLKFGANAWLHQRDFKTPNRNGCQ